MKWTGSSNLSLTLTPASGLFSGSLKNPAGKIVAVKGVVLQSQTNGYGFFLGTNQSGSVYLGDPSLAQ